MGSKLFQAWWVGVLLVLMWMWMALAACTQSGTPTVTPMGAAIIGTVNHNANLHAGPGTHFAVVGDAKAGQTVQISGANPDRTWYQLVDQRWIAAFLVTVPTPVSPLPIPPTSVSSPQILFFSVTPTTTYNLGDQISLAWAAIGKQAMICPIIGINEGRCQNVPLAGQMMIVTDEQSMYYSSFGLSVTAGQSAVRSMVAVHLQCQNWRKWFFSNAPLACPATPPSVAKAAFQRFERGMMIWVEGPQEAPADDMFMIFFENDPTQPPFVRTYMTMSGELPLKPGASPAHRSGEIPPPDRYEPVSGFGLLWRGEVEVPPQYQVPADQKSLRERLGWALAPEVGYDFAEQCELPVPVHFFLCYIGLPDGKVLRIYPDSTAQAHSLWEEWQGP
jgi:hypothetical protein